MECKRASPEETREAFAQVHEIWPHADHPEVHLQKRLASIQHQRAEWWVLRNEAGVQASCGAYPLTLFGPDGNRSARGFGAVYTVPAMRGQGCAAKLLRFVMDSYNSQGTSDFLLFSDIEPAYYERMGFHRLGSWRFEIAAEPLLPEASWSLEKIPVYPEDPGVLGFRYGIQRSPEDNVFVLAKQNGRLRKVRVLDSSKQPMGYWILSGLSDTGQYMMLESNIPQDRTHWALFSTLIAADAAEVGASRACGWWTAPSHLDIASDAISSRRTEILMWTSMRALDDPWVPALQGEGFRVFNSEHF